MNWYMYAMIIAVVLVIFAGILWNILKSPFSYPYYDKDFNVSGKRNPEINDFIDKYICKYGLCPFSNHYKKVEEWKEFNRKFIEKCRLKNLRKKQLDEAIDDTHMFRFHLVRNQTRYRQKNYVKSSYVVRISIDDRTYSFDWIQQRFAALELIGFECSLSEYASIEQRKLMTKELRNMLLEIITLVRFVENICRMV